ncbi:MAG: hypothetical protein FWF11_01695 [Coriobacteriia bacterium]|nr:hypothetical protein [Coriobacteriia bacterium]
MNIVAEITHSVGELIAPTRCAGCERQGALLCHDCLLQLSAHYLPQQACHKCAGPYGALTCTECWDLQYSFSQALALGILDGALARAVVLYKDSNERRLADVLGHLLAKRVQAQWGRWAQIVCAVPASTEAVRRRGFDHGELLSRSVAAGLQIPAIQLLEQPQARRDQRELSREQRLAGKQGFRCKRVRRLPKRVLLVDDVFTTGGTAQSATEALLAAGVKSVRLAVLGRAW